MSELMNEARIRINGLDDVSWSYFSFEKTKKLVDSMLEGYEIVKANCLRKE